MSASRSRRDVTRPAVIFVLLLAAGLTSGVAAGGDGNPSFAPLEWLLGSWEGAFFDDARQAPTMTFEWGDDRGSWLRLVGTRPGPDGGLVREHETMILWHPVRQRFVFQTVYYGGRVVEDGDIDLLPDGSVRFNMRVHYPAGAALPFSDGAVAGAEGHTLAFRRTFHRDGVDGLRGEFHIERESGWEQPRLDVEQGDGFRWRRLAGTSGGGRAEP